MSKLDESRPFLPVNIAVLTVSDTRGLADDRSGDTLAERIRNAGHVVAERTIVKDEQAAIAAQLRAWISDPRIDVVISTGGTGVTGRDGTPEAVTPLFDKVLDGFGEMFRVLSYEDIKTSTLQSRAVAGVANATYVFTLPGSSGACALGWDKLIVHQLDYRTRP